MSKPSFSFMSSPDCHVQISHCSSSVISPCEFLCMTGLFIRHVIFACASDTRPAEGKTSVFASEILFVNLLTSACFLTTVKALSCYTFPLAIKPFLLNLVGCLLGPVPVHHVKQCVPCTWLHICKTHFFGFTFKPACLKPVRMSVRFWRWSLKSRSMQKMSSRHMLSSGDLSKQVSLVSEKLEEFFRAMGITLNW